MTEGTVFPEYIGKTVAQVVFGDDPNGYPLLTILFTDNTVLRVREQSQTGYFAILED